MEIINQQVNVVSRFLVHATRGSCWRYWLVCCLCFLTVASVTAQENTEGKMTPQPPVRITSPGCWFYSDLWALGSSSDTFILCSYQPDQRKPDMTPEPKLTNPLLLTFWEVTPRGRSQSGILCLRSYNVSEDVPVAVSTAEDLYLFFLAHQRDVTPTAPVARHTPGGWTWQTLDSISTSIRRKVMFFDIDTDTVINGMGEQLTDLRKLKENLPAKTNVVSFSCQLEGNTTAGLLGKVASREKVSPPLPYEALYRYSVKGDEIPQIIPLGPITDGPLPDIDNPTLASKALPGQEAVITFGKPVSEGTRVLYWYCIQQKEKPTYRVYVLACYDGRRTIAIDGYIVNPPDVRYWINNTWVKEHLQLEWAYQPQLGFPVQPLVGKDATGKFISYRPPELWRLEIAPDADEAPQKDAPTAGIPTK